MDLSQMNPVYFVIAVLVVMILIVSLAIYVRSRSERSARLRRQFGPEYEHALRQKGSERRAEAVLINRQRRVERLDIRELAPIERERFTNQWNALLLRFVDSPRGVVTEADDLIVLLMQTRGYPMSDFEQRAADISVDHPLVVQNYRAAHTIVSRMRSGEATTEELRNAMIHYRALLDEMLQAAPMQRRDAA